MCSISLSHIKTIGSYECRHNELLNKVGIQQYICIAEPTLTSSCYCFAVLWALRGTARILYTVTYHKVCMLFKFTHSHIQCLIVGLNITTNIDLISKSLIFIVMVFFEISIIKYPTVVNCEL